MPFELAPITDASLRLVRWHHSSALFDPGANVLWLDHVRENQTIAVHELMHFFEHCATPYGLFKDEIHQQSLIDIEQFLTRYTGPVYTPVYTWVKQRRWPSDVDAAALEVILSETLSPWSQLIYFRDFLEGFVEETAIDRLVRVLQRHEGDNAAPLRSDSTIAVAPQVKCEGTEDRYIPIGALHVSECLAQIQEGPKSLASKKVGPEYYALQLLGKEKFTTTERRFPARIGRDLDITCLVLADLAMFTPAGKLYHSLRAANTTWMAIHPGWRFFHALELVTKKDWWIGSLFEAEELVNRICDCLGWLTPRQFLEWGVEQTEPSLLRHRDASRIRLADFMAFYRRDRIFESTSPVAAFLSDHLPITYYPGLGTILNVPQNDDENDVALQQLAQCYKSLRLLSIMTNHYKKTVLPTQIPYHLYFDNITCEADLGSLYSMKYPWLKELRFHKLCD